MARLTINLEPEERRALEILADRELRDVRNQAMLIIRQRLEQLDLLPANNADQSEVGA